MKKLYLLILSFILVFILLIISGCHYTDNYKNGQQEFYSQSQYANAILKDLLSALVNNDKQKIFNLFSEDVRNSDGFDAEIEQLINYFDGNVIFYEKIVGVAGGEIVRDGVLTHSHITNANCKEIITSNSVYSISFTAILVDDREEREGLWRIWIGKSDEDYMVIGSDNYDL